MKLSDVMSALNLAVYAEVGLVLFLFAFLLVAVDVLRRGQKLEKLAYLPLESNEQEPKAREERS
ncbi:MAG: hypothetical protein M3020_03900 [Myxococcota bacterium]|nr:hypothetical protein [Myxococcota bacterium]